MSAKIPNHFLNRRMLMGELKLSKDKQKILSHQGFYMPKRHKNL